MWLTLLVVVLALVVLFAAFSATSTDALYTGLLGTLLLHFAGYNNERVFFCALFTLVVAVIFYAARRSAVAGPVIQSNDRNARNARTA